VRRYASKMRTRKCPECGHWMSDYHELIRKDEETAANRLRAGGIRVA
jgi:hypothetical protein